MVVKVTLDSVKYVIRVIVTSTRAIMVVLSDPSSLPSWTGLGITEPPGSWRAAVIQAQLQHLESLGFGADSSRPSHGDSETAGPAWQQGHPGLRQTLPVALPMDLATCGERIWKEPEKKAIITKVSSNTKPIFV